MKIRSYIGNKLFKLAAWVSPNKKENNMSLVQAIYKSLVVGNQKAIVGFVLAAGAVLVSKVGLSLDVTIGQALEAGVSALVVSVGVWLKVNR